MCGPPAQLLAPGLGVSPNESMTHEDNVLWAGIGAMDAASGMPIVPSTIWDNATSFCILGVGESVALVLMQRLGE